jgi:hypothetical protein
MGSTGSDGILDALTTKFAEDPNALKILGVLNSCSTPAQLAWAITYLRDKVPKHEAFLRLQFERQQHIFPVFFALVMSATEKDGQTIEHSWYRGKEAFGGGFHGFLEVFLQFEKVGTQCSMQEETHINRANKKATRAIPMLKSVPGASSIVAGLKARAKSTFVDDVESSLLLRVFNSHKVRAETYLRDLDTPLKRERALAVLLRTVNSVDLPSFEAKLSDFEETSMITVADMLFLVLLPHFDSVYEVFPVNGTTMRHHFVGRLPRGGVWSTGFRRGMTVVSNGHPDRYCVAAAAFDPAGLVLCLGHWHDHWRVEPSGAGMWNEAALLAHAAGWRCTPGSEPKVSLYTTKVVSSEPDFQFRAGLDTLVQALKDILKKRAGI